MKNVVQALCVGVCAVGLSYRALAQDAPAPTRENVDLVVSEPVPNALDLVFEDFDVVTGNVRGEPYLRVQGAIRQLSEGKVGPATLVLERVMVAGDNVTYLVRPRPGKPQAGAGVGILEPQRTQAFVELEDAEWGRTYTFVVLNFTGGTSARHAGVHTVVVPLIGLKTR